MNCSAISPIFSCSVLLLLYGCALNRPAVDELAFDSGTIPDDKARIVLFRTRDSALYFARKASISLGGKETGVVGHGSFLVRYVDASKHSLRADMWDMPGQCELMLAAAPGETYYLQVDPRSESFGAFAAGDLATQLVTTNVFVNVAAGVSAVAAGSYGRECGGAFRIYPVDPETAIARLAQLKRAD